MRVAVIGAGIQGCCIALELAERGVSVDLIEALPEPMEAASRNNEGKIHLGFVYAKDTSLRTARLQMRGAAVFERLMNRWLGQSFDEVPVSSTFNYVVHVDSALSPSELEESYARMAEVMKQEFQGDTYFGFSDPWLVTPLEPEALGDTYGPAVQRVYSTREVAVDPEFLADSISKRVLDEPLIRPRCSTRVTDVNSPSRTLTADTPGGHEQLGPFDHVVNAAWGGRPAIDKSFGLDQQSPWSYRMKYFIRLLDTDLVLPSSTIVLGGFGDVVDYRNRSHYLSWYPVGRRGWSTALTPPEWPSRLTSGEAESLAGRTLRGLADVVPGVQAIDVEKANIEALGGLIYALGDTDIDDPKSRLHSRKDVGPVSLGWYHSVDTGKYTTAPLFALETADRITT